MPVRPRWRKLAGDLRAAWGRIVLAQLAIALALAGVGTVMAIRAVLGREIRASYQSTRPADATLELAGAVDDALLAEVRARPDIAEADRRQTLHARIKLREEDPWQMLVLFVADDWATARLNVVRPASGAWPPPAGSLLLERTAPAVMGLGSGAAGGHARRAQGHGHAAAMMAALGSGTRAILSTPHGTPGSVAIAGTVHDAGQAPSWQEHRGCAYTTPATLALLGEPPGLPELLVRFRPDARSTADASARAAELARWLTARGQVVHQIRVPRLGAHPHQGLMDAAQLVMLAFSLLLLMLAAVVAATILSAILARQTREIGVMKAIGARTGQLAALYAVFVLGLGLIAVAVAAPLAALAAGALVEQIGGLMNLRLADRSIPAQVWLALAALGTLVPLAIAAVPIRRATRISVRRALAGDGGGSFARPAMARLPVALRNALRRPARLAMTLTLLVLGGALVLAAANVERGLGRISAKLDDARHFDVELALHDPISTDQVAALAAVPGVRTVEGWASIEAAPGASGVVHTYPDGGHGSFRLVAPPAAGSTLVTYPLRAGRWLQPGDRDALVLGHNAARGARPGDRFTLMVDGRPWTGTVVGLVEEVGGASAFVTAETFAAITGQGGATVIRIATTAGDRAGRAATLAALERTLAGGGARVAYALPAPLLRTIIDDHVALVVRAVIVVSAILALVGLFGLGSAMALGVAERSRELAIMKAIGAGRARLMAIVLGEAVAIAAVAAALAALLSLPITLLVDARIAAGGFIAPPPFAIAGTTLLLWPLVLVAGSVLASLPPALRAAHLSVRAGLAEV